MTQNSTINPLKLGISLVIDYFRWSQLSPMIVLWGGGLLFLAAMYIVNHQEVTSDILETVARWIASLPMVGDAFIRWGEAMAGEDGTIHLGGKDLEAAILKLWGGLSLGFLILAMLVGWLFGPFKPWTLQRKIALVGLGSLALIAAFALVYFLDPSQFNGPALDWMLIFTGVGVILFIVSTWCLSISHLPGACPSHICWAGSDACCRNRAWASRRKKSGGSDLSWSATSVWPFGTCLTRFLQTSAHIRIRFA